MQEGSNIAVFFKVVLPNPFPTKLQNIKIPITEPKSTKVNSVPLAIDENVVQNLISNPFIFTLLIPAEIPPTVSQKNHSQKSSKLQEKYGDGHLQLDGHNILLPTQLSTSFSCHTSSFSSIKFTLSISQPIFTPQLLLKFTPLFICLRKVENMPETPTTFSELTQKFAPVSFKATINGKDIFYIAPQMHQTNHAMDAIIIRSPREQAELSFEVHDRDKLLPQTQYYIGNGYIEPYIPSMKRRGLYLDADLIIEPDPKAIYPYGYCKFNILPERKNRISILPFINHKCPVQPGNFHKCETDLCYETIDPSSEIKPEDIQSEPSSPSQTNQKPQKPQKHSSKSKSKKHSSESSEVNYYRWILVATRDNQGENYAKMLDCVVKEHHKLLFDEESETVLQTYNYKTSVKLNPDVITGFHLTTPTEHIIIIESRAVEPNFSFLKISKFFNTTPPKCARFFYDVNVKFPSPRQYSKLSTLYQFIELPVSILEFVKVEQLYFHNSVIYVLFEVIQKLTAIIKAKDFKFICDNEMFPTVEQMIQLITKADSLPSYIKPKEDNDSSLHSTISSIKSKTSFQSTRPNTSFMSRTVPQTPISPFSPMYSGARTTANSRLMTPRGRRTEDPSTPPIPVALAQRAPFSLYGKGPKTTRRAPNGRIAVSSNGDMELWYTKNPEALKEDGWEVEILKQPKTSRERKVKSSYLPFTPYS